MTATTFRWRMTFEVWVEADNEKDAQAAQNRIGDRIEDHPMVVGCEDSPVQNEGVAP